MAQRIKFESLSYGQLPAATVTRSALDERTDAALASIKYESISSWQSHPEYVAPVEEREREEGDWDNVNEFAKVKCEVVGQLQTPPEDLPREDVAPAQNAGEILDSRDVDIKREIISGWQAETIVVTPEDRGSEDVRFEDDDSGVAAIKHEPLIDLQPLPEIVATNQRGEQDVDDHVADIKREVISNDQSHPGDTISADTEIRDQHIDSTSKVEDASDIVVNKRRATDSVPTQPTCIDLTLSDSEPEEPTLHGAEPPQLYRDNARDDTEEDDFDFGDYDENQYSDYDDPYAEESSIGSEDGLQLDSDDDVEMQLETDDLSEEPEDQSVARSIGGVSQANNNRSSTLNDENLRLSLVSQEARDGVRNNSEIAKQKSTPPFFHLMDKEITHQNRYLNRLVRDHWFSNETQARDAFNAVVQKIEFISIPGSLNRLREEALPSRDKKVDMQRADRYQLVPFKKGQGHTLIHDWAGLPIAMRLDLTMQPAFADDLTKLAETTEALPKKAKQTSRTRFYGIWTDSSPVPYVTSDTRKDEIPARRWFSENRPLFEKLGTSFKIIQPEMFRSASRLVQYDDLIKHFPGHEESILCSPWHAVAINQDTKGGKDRTEGHRFDKSDSKLVWNCLVPFGNFTGGNYRLSSIRKDIELPEGTALMFYTRLLHHGLLPVTSGVRNSINLLTHNSTMVWLRRADGEKERPEHLISYHMPNEALREEVQAQLRLDQQAGSKTLPTTSAQRKEKLAAAKKRKATLARSKKLATMPDYRLARYREMLAKQTAAQKKRGNPAAHEQKLEKEAAREEEKRRARKQRPAKRAAMSTAYEDMSTVCGELSSTMTQIADTYRSKAPPSKPATSKQSGRADVAMASATKAKTPKANSLKTSMPKTNAPVQTQDPQVPLYTPAGKTPIKSERAEVATSSLPAASLPTATVPIKTEQYDTTQSLIPTKSKEQSKKRKNDEERQEPAKKKQAR